MGIQQLLLGGAGVVVPLPLSSITDSRVGFTSDIVWINFGTEGLIEAYRHGNILVWSNDWYRPQVAGIGATYWIRASNSSGQDPNGGSDSAFNTWLQLNSLRSWSMFVSGSAGTTDTRAGTVLIEIALDSAGVDIVTSGTVFMSAEYDDS